jgi:hypothetical protein
MTDLTMTGISPMLYNNRASYPFLPLKFLLFDTAKALLNSCYLAEGIDKLHTTGSNPCNNDT